MQLRNSAQRYGTVPKLLHWLTVGLVVLAWSLGTFGDDLPRVAARSAGLFVHISTGLMILALLVIRLFWRLIDPPPPPEITPFGSWLVLAEARPFCPLRAAGGDADCRRSAAIRSRRCVAVIRLGGHRLAVGERSCIRRVDQRNPRDACEHVGDSRGVARGCRTRPSLDTS